jgi:phosphatidylglycerophosphate synthase
MKNRSLESIYGLLFLSGRCVRIVSVITLYRTIIFPLLIILIFTGYENLFKWLLLVSFSTDAIDGYLARKYKIVSVLGAKLDSIGDDLTVLAALIALFKMHPEFLKEEIVIIAGYSAKTAALFQGVFLLIVFFFESISYPFFYSVALVTALGLVEETILAVLLPEWRADVKGLYWVLKEKK